MSKKTKILARITRNYRKIHKWVAAPLILFMFLTGLTGVLPGWKKQANLPSLGLMLLACNG